MHVTRLAQIALCSSILGFVACSASSSDGGGKDGNGNEGSLDGVGEDSTGNDGLGVDSVDGGVDGNGTGNDNPVTCAEAASARSYVGCDFWPTVTANPVWTEFKPAVVVANGGAEVADITVTGPNGFSKTESIPPGELRTVLLEWVDGLKGPLWAANTSTGRLVNSSRVDGGAYHLTATRPVTAWQFNPLKYRMPRAECGSIPLGGEATECRSASNDASILLPSTAMTGNYRVFGYSSKHEGTDWGTVPGAVAITATADGTEVQVQLGPKCGARIYPTTDLGGCVAASADGVIAEKNAGDIYTLTMNAGDVVQLVGKWNKDPQVENADISGSVIVANKPVQAIAFNAIAMLPDGSVGNADHMEETVLPGEVLGKKYIVAPPTAPHGEVVGHVVRFYGNVDGTTLTYPAGKPAGAPDTLNAGDVVQIPAPPTGTPAPQCVSLPDHCAVTEPFVVEGDQPFAVASFMLGGVVQEGNGYDSLGDPSFMMLVAPDQFRKAYTFLAPNDFVQNFADILVPDGAQVKLDGAAVSATPTAIGMSGWSILRAPLSNDGSGIHSVTTDDERGVGVSVAGFGYATSYYYPGGLNLKLISKPPVIVK